MTKFCLDWSLLALAMSSSLLAQAAIETLPVQGQVQILASPAGNSVVQTGPDGVLVVDTRSSESADDILRAIRTLSTRDIRYLVLTSNTPQQVGAAGALSKAGRNVRLIDGNDPRGGDARASIIGHANLLNRMAALGLPADSWPTDTYFTADWSIFSNGEAVQFFHLPNATTDGDTLVFFRRSDVVVTGPAFDATSYPRFDRRSGGTVKGVIEGLNKILDITIAGPNQEGGTVVVPVRGRLSDETDVANYRDMVTIVRDRVQDMATRGMTLDDVLRSNPTADYAGLYDYDREWTARQFVEAIFDEVRAPR
jgi:cyclase